MKNKLTDIIRFLKIKKLDIYIIRKFMAAFILSIILLSIIIIVFDIAEKIDDFIANKAPTKSIIRYYINFLPSFINQFGSLFVFISVIFFTSKLASRSEIVAIFSNGVTYARFLYPYILTSTFIAGVLIYNNNFLLPNTNKFVRKFEIEYWHGNKYEDTYHTHMQIEPNTYIYIQSYIDNENMGYNFYIEKFQNGKLLTKHDASNIQWLPENKKWRLSNVQIRECDEKGDKISFLPSKDTTLSFSPYDFKTNVDDVKTMNYYELRYFLNKEKLKGSSSIAGYEVEKYKRISFPISAIILTLIGVALSGRKVRGGIGMHIGLGILITFTYIMVLQITSVYATIGGVLSPFWACWIPNFMFLALAIFLLKKAQK